MIYEIKWSGSDEWCPIGFLTLLFFLKKLGWTTYQRAWIFTELERRPLLIFRGFYLKMVKSH